MQATARHLGSGAAGQGGARAPLPTPASPGGQRPHGPRNGHWARRGSPGPLSRERPRLRESNRIPNRRASGMTEMREIAHSPPPQAAKVSFSPNPLSSSPWASRPADLQRGGASSAADVKGSHSSSNRARLPSGDAVSRHYRAEARVSTLPCRPPRSVRSIACRRGSGPDSGSPLPHISASLAIGI